MMESRTAALYVREFGTAALFAIFVVSALFFWFYLVRGWRQAAGEQRWRALHTDVNQAAIGWFTASVGELLRSGAALLVFNRFEHGYNSIPVSISITYVIGTLVCLWGMICLMRALSHGEWCRGMWTGLIVGALVFGAAFVFF